MVKEVERIIRGIKSVKIQGATNIAKAAVKIYSISPSNSTIKKLVEARPTEPMLQNVIETMKKGAGKNEILMHFSEAQEKINKNVLKVIKNNSVVFTHCHSTNVVKSLINAKRKGIKFEVYNTETRPLFQGRKTAQELSKAGIKVTMFVDSAIEIALEKKQDAKKVSIVFLGADAILKNSDVVNKVGSGLISVIAKKNKLPLYIIADSWKFSKNSVALEQRGYNEVWNDKIAKNIIIKNPAFEKVPAKNIKAIISELGILSPKEFVRKTKKRF